MRVCAECGGELEAAHRFCPWCAAPQRRKLVEFFRAHPRDAGQALRVSRYLTEDPHVRFSVWSSAASPKPRSHSTRRRPSGWPVSWRPLAACGAVDRLLALLARLRRV